MKTVKIETFAGNKKIEQNLEMHSATGLNKVIGTSINRIFEFNSLLRKYGNDYIKANDLLSIVISTENNVILDSYTLNESFGFKLKFGNTAKSKKKFCTILSELIKWAASDVKSLTLEELINTFEE